MEITPLRGIHECNSVNSRKGSADNLIAKNRKGRNETRGFAEYGHLMRIESSVLVLRPTEFIGVSLFLTHFRPTKEGLVNIDRNNRSTLSLVLSRTPEASAWYWLSRDFDINSRENILASLVESLMIYRPYF